MYSVCSPFSKERMLTTQLQTVPLISIGNAMLEYARAAEAATVTVSMLIAFFL